MTDRTAYLLLLAAASDRRFSDYVAALPALHQRHGGQFKTIASAPMVEQYGHHGAAHAVVLSSWPSLQQLRAFWQSAAHCTLLSRIAAESTVAIALEGEPEADRVQNGESLAVFLGPSPTPALLEAAGAQALALVRERHVTPLQNHWAYGDVAIYSWHCGRSARQQLVAFSSGQRGRAMLLPALQTVKKSVASRPLSADFDLMLRAG